MRRPLQGVTNIVRFNRHLFVAALLACVVLAAVGGRIGGLVGLACLLTVAAIAVTTMISLVVSAYVYDLSGLYRLEWLDGVALPSGGAMANIHAGFDETTPALRARYPDTDWVVMDFYDPAKHTERSIRYARQAYPPSPDDQRVQTTRLPPPSESLDAVFLLLAAHEIRDPDERAAFFTEVRRVLRPSGRVIVLEHLRDVPNALAYTLGVLHFLSHRTWTNTIERAGLRVRRQFRPNPFLTCMVLEKHAV